MTYLVPPFYITPHRANLERLREAEKVKRETARAKNDLESFIIASLDSLQDDEGFLGASTEKERQGLIKQLTDAEEWLYGDGEHAKAAEYAAKLAKLRGPIDRVREGEAEGLGRGPALSVSVRVTELPSRMSDEPSSRRFPLSTFSPADFHPRP